MRLEEEEEKMDSNGVLITDVVGENGSQMKIAMQGQEQEVKQG